MPEIGQLFPEDGPTRGHHVEVRDRILSKAMGPLESVGNPCPPCRFMGPYIHIKHVLYASP